MSDHAVKEIVIVRHRSDDHGDDHHGGVWKIAFADFMTAMMAFFLVMWLINASNEATKKAVASYFNPIKLADVTSNPKGVQEPRYGATSKDSVVASSETTSKDKQADGKSRQAPTVDGPAAEASAKGPAAEPSSEPTDGTNGPITVDNGVTSAKGQVLGDEGLASVEGAAMAEAKVNPADGSAREQAAAGESPAPAQSDSALARAKEPLKPASKLSASPVAKEQPPASAETEAADIRQALGQEMGIGKAGPAISVKVVSDGVLVSLTDRLGFSMFQVGSSTPNAMMIEALKAVGQVLADRSGSLIIRGHTDSRQYHSSANDNWRLSSDRAHVAFESLVKGGVDERRIEHIEGFANRMLLKSKDPLAAENRRIEILIRPDVKQ